MRHKLIRIFFLVLLQSCLLINGMVYSEQVEQKKKESFVIPKVAIKKRPNRQPGNIQKTDMQNKQRIEMQKKQKEDLLKLVQIKTVPDNKSPDKENENQTVGKDGSAMVLIPSGEFWMGSPDSEGETNEKPRHKVFLDNFYIDKYEITNEQYAKFLNSYGRDTDDRGNKMLSYYEWGIKKDGNKWIAAKDYEKYPAIFITWYGASQYARFYNKRLPTEAEWEKAARSGSSTKYFFGDSDDQLGEYAWYVKNSERKTHSVGKKNPNSFGVFDMYGNVWEWCSDWYDAAYYKSSVLKNPQGPSSGNGRVLRGGSWINVSAWCRSSYRVKFEPSAKANLGCGFRCVRQ